MPDHPPSPEEPLALGALHRPGNVCCQRLKLGQHFEGALQVGGGGSWRAFWPTERCAFMDALLDFDQSQLERQVDHLQLLLPSCTAWEKLTGGSGEALEAAALERGLEKLDASNDLERSFQELVSATIRQLPGGRMQISHFLTLGIHKHVCDVYHHIRGGVVPGRPVPPGLKLPGNFMPVCGLEEFHRHGTCDCVQLLQDNLRRLNAMPVGADVSTPQLVAAFFAPGGFSFNPNVHHAHLRTLRTKGARAGWARLIEYMPQHDPALARFERQRGFGQAMERALFELVAELDRAATGGSGASTSKKKGSSDRTSAAYAFDRAIRARHAVFRRNVEEDANELRQKVQRRTSQGLTMLAGKYGYLWNVTLRRRAAAGKEVFWEPLPSDRTRACGATVSHVTLPWAECEPVVKREGMADKINFEHPHNFYAAGVYRDGARGERCFVVMNRAVARSVLDASMVGLDCSRWYGAAQHTAHSRPYGTFSHASPLAVAIVLATKVEHHYRRYRAARDALAGEGALPGSGSEAPPAASGDGSGGGAAPAEAWRAMQREIASLFYFFWNVMPLIRGSPTTGLLLHHALWLAPLPSERRAEGLLCVPPLARDVLLDWEAMSVRTVHEYVHDVWWGLFEGRAAGMLGCLERVRQGGAAFADADPAADDGGAAQPSQPRAAAGDAAENADRAEKPQAPQKEKQTPPVHAAPASGGPIIFQPIKTEL